MTVTRPSCIKHNTEHSGAKCRSSNVKRTDTKKKQKGEYEHSQNSQRIAGTQAQRIDKHEQDSRSYGFPGGIVTIVVIIVFVDAVVVAVGGGCRSINNSNINNSNNKMSYNSHSKILSWVKMTESLVYHIMFIITSCHRIIVIHTGVVFMSL